ncbi:protein FAM13B-like isoform X2 [Ostrea edulis]|uniref:protein FAM13B-like isoform X2 n=1 Tax=Ostrea edulis TaxID=37623 RepID=UPI0024AFACFD|nr:protein FAM13B-like isoform X2 [Ostrea edulis]XP_056017821.1 protein FAM13B-like isoform X2 [Ostrea edulis]XP_056017822.1 protein FAM13B-like isoform X2 [Ostrea edulis]
MRVNVKAGSGDYSIQDVNTASKTANFTMSSVDKMKKLLSPGTRKKGLGNVNKTFGVPLEELMTNASSGSTVPYLVSKICEHIRDKGFDTEGIFRINGSTRIVEKYRTSFDMRGDANFYEEEDLMAVASLLKLFLREIPGSLIPENKTQKFIAIQEENQNDPAGCISGLKAEISQLEVLRYNLLRYLIRFLVVVAQFERSNKMSPMSLAIVFGPNLFRCGQGIVGLKDQGKINQIVYKFITHYDALFMEENEISPCNEWIKQKQKAPPRPPPPKLQVEEYKPVPKPRNTVKMDPYDSTPYQDMEDYDHSEESSSNTQGRSHSPRCSDDEIAGRASPFILDSDGGYSIIESPLPSARTSEMVENVIARSIKEHLFGDDISMCETFVEKDQCKENLENAVPVKDRIKQFEFGSDTCEMQRTSKVPSWSQPELVHMDSSTSQVLQKVNGYKHQADALSSKENEFEDLHTDEDFESVRRDSGTLSSLQFKKPSGPRNRRSPSRRSRSNSLEDKEDVERDFQSQNGNAYTEVETSSLPETKPVPKEPVPKPRVAFLELTNHTENKVSSDISPSNARKPFIPLLDLSTLHEHVESSDPIPADKGQSVSYQLAKSHINGGDTPDVVISPRSNKLIKRKSSVPMNTDVAPSPPVNQDHYKHSSTNLDNDITTRIKQQSKKLHALKKKLKHFEDNFEKENGYKPSLADKASKPTIKKWMNDISKAKREIKRLKEEAEIGNRSRHGSGTSSSGERLEPPELPPTMEQTLNIILLKLDEKRRDAKRPEDVDIMNSDQVLDEKLAVQKALLHFENLHGRPKTRDEKDLMRPLYDRYRKIKRLLSKPNSPREKKELQTVPEDEPIELEGGIHNPYRPSVQVPAFHYDDLEDGLGSGLGTIGTMDFAVTRDFSVLRDTVRPVSKEVSRKEHSPKAKRKLSLPEEEEEEGGQNQEPNLHEMSIPELQDELMKSKGEKKRIRRTLRNFEEAFFQKNGRKVQRDDREPLQTEYTSYKQVKAKLKLLEALLSKLQNTDEV